MIRPAARMTRAERVLHGRVGRLDARKRVMGFLRELMPSLVRMPAHCDPRCMPDCASGDHRCRDRPRPTRSHIRRTVNRWIGGVTFHEGAVFLWTLLPGGDCSGSLSEEERHARSQRWTLVLVLTAVLRVAVGHHGGERGAAVDSAGSACHLPDCSG